METRFIYMPFLKCSFIFPLQLYSPFAEVRNQFLFCFVSCRLNWRVPFWERGFIFPHLVTT